MAFVFPKIIAEYLQSLLSRSTLRDSLTQVAVVMLSLHANDSGDQEVTVQRIPEGGSTHGRLVRVFI